VTDQPSTDAPEPTHTVVLPGTDAPLAEGELVVLIDRKRRRYLVTLEAGAEWHSHGGIVAHDDLVGVAEGSAVRTTKGMEVVALRPTREDFVLKMKRGAQVVYPKDQAMIVAAADVRPGCTVVEAGAGSGALTLTLLAAVGEQGRVVSVELREDHAVHAGATSPGSTAAPRRRTGSCVTATSSTCSRPCRPTGSCSTCSSRGAPSTRPPRRCRRVGSCWPTCRPSPR
jgi:hypothetical protein